MKTILAVVHVAILLAVTHLGDTHGDHTPRPPHCEPLVVDVMCVFASSNSLFYLHNITVLAEKPLSPSTAFGERALTPVFQRKHF